ncbi:MAG: ribosome assembly cofactor RimP [Crocinitomicaceae bacterium]
MIAKKRIEELANERIAERDPSLFVVEITVGSNNKIVVELDKEDGFVSIEDCKSVSRNIEHNLDREIEDFALEVSSAGLNKPFRVLKQYVKNIGRDVKVQAVEHGSSVEGVLKNVDENGFVVETKEKKRIEGKKKKEWVLEEIPFNYNEVKETKLVISF